MGEDKKRRVREVVLVLRPYTGVTLAVWLLSYYPDLAAMGPRLATRMLQTEPKRSLSVSISTTPLVALPSTYGQSWTLGALSESLASGTTSSCALAVCDDDVCRSSDQGIGVQDALRDAGEVLGLGRALTEVSTVSGSSGSCSRRAVHSPS